MNPSLLPTEAWKQLPESAWNAAAARHLLRRAGWSARPTEVDRAIRDGLSATLDRLLSTAPVPMAKPRMVARRD